MSDAGWTAAEAAAWAREPAEVWEREAAEYAAWHARAKRRAALLALADLLAAEVREHDAQARKLRRRALDLLEEAKACREWAHAVGALAVSVLEEEVARG